MNDYGNDPISLRGDSNPREYCGVGRVILPKTPDGGEVDREKYIKRCMDTATVSIINRVHLDIVHDVPVDPDVLQRIRFPKDSNELGSSIVWVNIPIYNRPIVIALLNTNDDMSNIEEGSFKIFRGSGPTSVGISGTVRKGNINISAISGTGSGGVLNITVSNTGNEAQMNVNVSGYININSRSTTVSVSENLKVEAEDPDTKKLTTYEISGTKVEARVKEGKSGHKIEEESYEIGDASVTAAIAEETEALFHSILDELSKTTVTTAIGPSPLLNAAQLLALKADTTKIFSKYLKIQ